MKFTYNWLKDFVDVKLPPQKLADKLTMAGIEVVSLEERDGDCIFEIEITSNRPDWLSVIGIAREVAAITNSKLKVTSHKSQVTSHKQKHATCDMRPLSIKVENKNDCPLYTAKIIKGVKVGPAPEWMRKRLELIGCRSVNNVVDITNYILFTYGHPLHAFDLHRLNSDTIVVRRAKSGERIATINDKAVGLDKEILVIANKDKPVAVAGVIGGKDTEVTGDTKEILLESAVFNPVIVRRSRQKLGLQTESSYRFERGTDFQTAVAAALKALTLLQEFAAGICAQEKSTALPQKSRLNIRTSLMYVLIVFSMYERLPFAADPLQAIGKPGGDETRILLRRKGHPGLRQDLPGRAHPDRFDVRPAYVGTQGIGHVHQLILNPGAV